MFALRLQEVVTYLAYLRGVPSKGKNVLIFGQGRSGTTLFETLLVSTGYFKGLHEVLNTVTRDVWWPKAYVAGLGRRWPNRNLVVHIKPEHLGRARKSPVDARQFLEAMVQEGWTIVHIQRRDLLRQLLSKHVAKARGAFHKKDDQPESIRLSIPEDAFMADYERRLGWLENENQLLQGLSSYQITYEEHLESPSLHQPTVNKLLEHLGLEIQPVSTQLRKIGKDKADEFLANADSLRNAFEKKGWEWTL